MDSGLRTEIELKRIGLACAAAVTAVSGIALAGWLTQRLDLASVTAAYIPMAPSTAICCLLLSFPLTLSFFPPGRRSVRIGAGLCIAAVFLLSLILMIDFIQGTRPEIEHSLFGQEGYFGTVPIGHMSPITAACFAAACAAFALQARFPQKAAYAAAAVTGMGLVLLLGYLYGTPVLYGGSVIPVALPTAFAFVVLGMGQLAAAGKDMLPISMFVGQSVRARLMRAFLPLVLLAALAASWVDLALPLPLLKNPALTSSLTAIVSALVFSVIIARTSRVIGSDIDAAIAAQRKAEREVVRVNRVLTTLTECNQALVRIRDEAELLRESCRIIVEIGGYSLALVAYTEKDEEKTIRPAAHAGYPEGFMEKVKFTWAEDDGGRGPVVSAVRDRSVHVFRNIDSDSYPPLWREAARERGYGSAVGLPLFAGDDVCGALAIYSAERNGFDEREMALLAELAGDLSYGITALRTRAEHDRAERALRESEEHYKRLVASVTSYIYTVRVEAETPVETAHGPGCLAVTGYAPAEYAANPHLWRHMIHPDDRGDVDRAVHRLLSGGHGGPVEHRIMHKNGTVRWVRDTMVPRRDEQGTLIAYDGLISDITDLKESEERFRTIFENATDGLLLADAETHRFRIGNGAIRRMLGVGDDELEKLEIGDIHPEEDLPRVLDQFERQARGDLTVARDLPVRRRDGSVFYADISVFSLTLRGRRYLCGNFRDVTERREAERRLNEYSAHLEQMVQQRTREAMGAQQEADAANRAKSDFLANMSHELRTPLNSILGFSEILQDELFGSLTGKQQEYVAYIHASGDHLLSIINDILDISKVESGKLSFDSASVSVDTVLAAATALFRERAVKQRITLDLDAADTAGLVIETDERKLKQILFNLLSNAVKFTPEGGRVRVQACRVRGAGSRTQEDHHKDISNLDRADSPVAGAGLPDSHGNFIEITVSDTGLGIKSEDREKLFKPFSQIESGYARTYEGTGLGLALTKRLVEFLGGSIVVESEFGTGSTFTFTLPLHLAEAGGETERGD